MERDVAKEQDAADQNLHRLQQVNLKMIHLVDEICEKYQLRYYALGGTLLGAVRHHGFIPWDDDVDIGMPRDDFEHFLNLASDLLPEPYHLRTIADDDGYRTYMIKIEDTSVQFTREYYTKDGVVSRNVAAWIDIMPIDGAPAYKDEFYRHLKCVRRLRQLVSFSMLDRCMGAGKKRSRLQKAAIRIGLRTGVYRLLSTKLLYKLLEKTCRKYPVRKSLLWGNYYGNYGRREFVRREVFGEPVRLEFEDMKIACPKDYDTYLHHIYGDYHKLPPISERRGHEIRFADA